jgi:hypothetical protein
MKHKNPLSGLIAGLAALFAAAAGTASADVTTQQKMSVDGVGMMAVGNMSGTTTTAISGNRSRTDSDVQLESKFVRFLARNAVGPSADIVLLDSDKLYHINMNKKEYTESSFAELRTRMHNALQGKGAGDGETPRQPSAIDQSKCEWLEPKSEVKKTGQKATLAGFDAEELVITAEQPCKDKETGAICEIALTLDEWLAPKLITNDEVMKYHRAYAQKLGLDQALNQDVNDRAKALFAQYKGIWADIVNKMKDAKGYPVRSSFSLAIGGDQCKQAQAAQQQSGDGNSGSSDSSSGSSSGDLAKNMGAKLGSLFHKKKDEAPPADSQSGQGQAAAVPPAVAGPSGTMRLMTINTELVSVSTAPIPSDKFEVPAGFKKVEQKGAT